MTTTTRLAPAVLLAALLPLTACGGDDDPSCDAAPTDSLGPGIERVAEGTLAPGDDVPAPDGKTVLTLTGVPVTNVGDALALDRETLQQIGMVEYTVDDRQAEGRDVVFTGPLVRDLLAVAGVEEGDATTLHTVALNDYSVDVPIEDAYELPVILAVLADGEPMSVARYGPTRLVYPTEGFDLDPTVYDPRWIWQLATIDVE